MEGFSHSGLLRRRQNSNEVARWASTCLWVSQLLLKGLEDMLEEGFSGGFGEGARGGEGGIVKLQDPNDTLHLT